MTIFDLGGIFGGGGGGFPGFPGIQIPLGPGGGGARFPGIPIGLPPFSGPGIPPLRNGGLPGGGGRTILPVPSQNPVNGNVEPTGLPTTQFSGPPDKPVDNRSEQEKLMPFVWIGGSILLAYIIFAQ